MKDGFKSIEIEPTECYLDFIGPAKPDDTNTHALKGKVRLSLYKSVKIRNMSIKFKGQSTITLQQPANLELTCPLLPKLKLPLFGRTTLPAGDHIIPWEMDIPNIYPRSIMIKRASINYKVIVSISTGITRTLTAEYPIVIRRHLLPYKELAPLIETRLFRRTIPAKFHYEIDTPQIVCIEQEHIPLAIKYISFASQKPVKTIKTRLIQIELYRRQSLSKTESDLSCSNKDSHILDLDKKIADSVNYKDTHFKYIKRTVPALIHIPNESTSAWKQPYLIRHRLHPYLSFTLDSPMVTIYHHLEITFQFGMKHDDIKSRIPVIIASIPKKDSLQLSDKPSLPVEQDNSMMMKYAFEEVAHANFLTYRLESRASTFMTDDESAIQYHEGTFSKVKDANLLSLMSFDEDIHTTDKLTPVSFGPSRTTSPTSPTPPIRPLLSQFGNSQSEPDTLLSRRALSPPPLPPQELTFPLYQNSKELKKFASAADISSSSEASSQQETERPRTTTPTMRRQNMYRKPQLPPINVDLANGKDTRGLTVLPLPRPPQAGLPLPPLPTTTSSGSGVLPILDRNEQSRSNIHLESSKRNRNNMSMEDMQSVYSEASVTSMNNAPSLSSSASLSTNKSQPQLQSRPPSPVFSPAPGLPATIPLRPQQEDTSRIEETFLSDGAVSPAMNTVASSVVLSPRTMYSLQRRIALSTISSLTNDSWRMGSSILPRGGRYSTQADSDVHSLMMQSSRYSSENSSHLYESTYQQLYSPPPPPPNPYINARLPPVPTTETTKSKSNKRSTMIYLEDSDNEDDGDHRKSVPPSPVPQLPPLETLVLSEPSTSTADKEQDCTPPKLPRLSFGKDFGISLGL